MSSPLIVLRTIRAGDQGGLIPSLSVSFGVVLAIGGIGLRVQLTSKVSFSVLCRRGKRLAAWVTQSALLEATLGTVEIGDGLARA